jgi:hypothetical protein
VIIHSDPAMSADLVREELFKGSLVLRTDITAVGELVQYARTCLADLFAPHDPESVHEHFSPAEMAGLLGTWKPAFIHDGRSKRLVEEIIREAGFGPERTYYDLPKPRTSFPVGHLNTGVAFAFPWHRDVWYSAPPQQINWWLPVFTVTPQNAISFDPDKFAASVKNDSHLFDYYVHNAGRHGTARQVHREVQARPGAHEHRADHEVTVIPAPGSVLLFSGAQLHTSIPNTSGRSRYSIDFRTVDVEDLVGRRGAPLVDAHCAGTAIRDFRRVLDGSRFDEQLVMEIFGAPPDGAELVFLPGGIPEE